MVFRVMSYYWCVCRLSVIMSGLIMLFWIGMRYLSSVLELVSVWW